MKKVIVLSILMQLIMICYVMSSENGDQILGTWLTEQTETGQSHVFIYREKNRYFGKIVWLEKPTYPPDDEEGMANLPKVDRRNPDLQLRNKPVIGLVILKNFEYAGSNKWKKGTIYDPANGKTYKCKMHLTEDGILKIRGYIGISLLGRTTEWSRVREGNQ